MTLGKEIYFSANTAQLYADSLPIAYALDYLAPEYTYGSPYSRSPLPYINHIAIPDYKIGLSLGTPVLTIPQSHSSQTVHLMSRPDATNLWKIYAAEAYSARGFALLPYEYGTHWTEPELYFYPNLNELKKYYDFITNNKRYYENLVSAARIAVLYAYKGCIESFYGICNLLLDAHFQYDILFAGDDN